MTPPRESGDVPRLGMIRDVSLFLREDHHGDAMGDLSYVAVETLGLHDWTILHGPDFGVVTADAEDGSHITLVSFDIDFLRMLMKWQDSSGEEETMDIPADKFAFYMSGWPEEWAFSGLVRYEPERQTLRAMLVAAPREPATDRPVVTSSRDFKAGSPEMIERLAQLLYECDPEAEYQQSDVQWKYNFADQDRYKTLADQAIAFFQLHKDRF